MKKLRLQKFAVSSNFSTVLGAGIIIAYFICKELEIRGH